MSTKRKVRKWKKSEIKLFNIYQGRGADITISNLTGRTVTAVSVARSYYKQKGMITVNSKLTPAQKAWETRRSSNKTVTTTSSNKKELNFLINGTQVIID